MQINAVLNIPTQKIPMHHLDKLNNLQSNVICPFRLTYIEQTIILAPTQSTRSERIPRFLSGQLMQPPDVCDNQESSSWIQPAHFPEPNCMPNKIARAEQQSYPYQYYDSMQSIPMMQLVILCDVSIFVMSFKRELKLESTSDARSFCKKITLHIATEYNLEHVTSYNTIKLIRNNLDSNMATLSICNRHANLKHHKEYSTVPLVNTNL